MADLELKKTLLSCPGDTIQEHINHIGMSQAELAKRLGRSVPKLNELIKGKAPLTKKTAAKLEYVLGVPANFWLNLERTYQDELLDIEQMEHLAECHQWVDSFPLSKMKKLGLLPNTRNKIALAIGLLKYFRVASPNEWSTIYKKSALTAKIELQHTAEPHAISVWLRLGELQAAHIKLALFDKKALRNSLKQIQAISYNHKNTWLKELQSLCSSCGVALVYTPCFTKAPIYSATRWIKNYAIPLIQITQQQKNYHAFWFTFYRELAHIIYHGKKNVFIEGIENFKIDKEKTEEANAFASRMLLSEKERKYIFKYQIYDKVLIIRLSQKFGIHPSIIVSQLQRKGLIKLNNINLSKLTEKVTFEPINM